MRVEKPNVLLITADQLRYDCVGYSGQRPVRTPHLDALAATGTAFRHAYSVLPVCSPARQSLLHGRRPEAFGALWNYSGALPVGALPPDAWTWSRALADAGYASAYIGKWGVNPSFGPAAYGYGAYVPESDYRAFAEKKYPNVAYCNGYFGERNPIPFEDAEPHWFADRAIEAMERLRQGDAPWHVALHLAEPHLPCRPSAPFVDEFDPADIPEWPGFRETFERKPYIQRQQLYSWGVERFGWDDWAPVVARYYAVISQLDDAVGKVLRALDALGEAERTIVIFTADHGDMCGSHGMMDKHYILYDDVVRVPLIVRLPGEKDHAAGSWPSGAVRDEFVYNFLDLAPTLLELLGLGLPDGGKEHEGSVGWLHGESLMPLLAGRRPDGWRDAVVSTYNGQQFGLYTQRMIRTARWKYVWNTTDIDELYDLADDPGELRNLIGHKEYGELIGELRRKLYDVLAADGDALVANEWTRRQLVNGAKWEGELR